MLQRFSGIRSTGGYLRHLCAKAISGTFTRTPMVTTLTRLAAA
ncbi:hypothetical protein ACFMBG_21375 [Leisingera sp. D0M16]